MARGKYSAKAETRRDREELASRAATAEAARVKAEQEKSEALTRAHAEISALRLELAKLHQHLADGTSPALIEVREAVDRQRRRAERAERRVTQWRRSFNEFIDVTSMQMERLFGVTQVEASDFLIGVASNALPHDWGLSEFMSAVNGRRSRAPKLPPGKSADEKERRSIQIQRARGLRNSDRNYVEEGLAPTRPQLGLTNRDLLAAVCGTGD